MTEINHKIKKDSIFQILNNPPKKMSDKNFFLFIFITGGFDRKIKGDILDFICDNQGVYGNYILIHDHIDSSLVNILDSNPSLIEVNADGVKRFNDKEAEKKFWEDIMRIAVARRSKQKAIIIESSDDNIPFKIMENADFIFVPKNMEMEKWKSRLIKY